MEKIKQALERARLDRQSGLHHVIGKASSSRDISSIEYTDTRSIDIPEAILKSNRLLCNMGPSDFTKAVKMLRTQVLQRMSENKWNALAITSPGENEGKTLTSINLGISMAMEVNYTVLLVDANLRQPDIHRRFGLKTKYGLSDYLMHDIPLSEILINPCGIERFVLLPGGEPIANSSEMLASPKMNALVNELKHRYPQRMVLFDLPAVLNNSDALAFVPYIDAALLVIEDNKSSAKDIKKAVELLSVTNVIGTVLNKAIN